MTDLRVDISAHAGGWRFQWHQDGAPVGGPVDVPTHAANQLSSLGSTIAQAFEHRSSDGFARLPLVPTAALDDIGRELRDLCCGPVAAPLADAGGTGRLTVSGDVPAALNLPWELLPVGGHGDRLGCHKGWGVFRTPAGAPRPPDVRRGGPLRILFLAAVPTDQPALDYEKEEEAILRATATLQGARLFTAELGTYEELDELLQRVKPHIVHLSGHGSLEKGVRRFCFESEAGRADRRAAAELAELFARRNVPCVFLNACETSQADVAGLCQALTAAGLPLALGWAASVADERATAFAETFYHELLAGEPLPAAAALARLRIQREGIRPQAPGRGEEQELTFLLPQLYASRPVEVLFDPQGPRETFQGVETRYELLPGGVKGLREGFVGRRREQQRLLPALRAGDTTFLLLHGVGGQGKSTLATRLVDRLRGAGFDVRAVLSRRQPDEAADSCATRAAAAVVKEISLAATLAGQEQLGALLGDEGKPLALRLLLAADALAKLKCVLVLDNFEDVLEVWPDGVWRIADAGLAEFYARVQTQLTSAQGGRVVVTSRYLPVGTQADLATVRVVAGLNDFKDYEFVKLLKRDERVARRIGRGELPMSLLRRLYDFVGGTPRFLERLRTLLQNFTAEELEKALNAGRGKLVDARDQYLEEHFGPKLFALLSGAAKALLSRLSLSHLPLPREALAALTGPDGTGLDAAIKQAVEFGLLQVFEETELPALYLPPGAWRGWLADRLTGGERTAAHRVLAAFWREVYEKDREGELRAGVIDGLRACRAHAKDGGNRELRLWASVLLSQFWERIGEWRAARTVLAEIPEADRDGVAWHTLASIDVNEGDYAAARDKFAKTLAMLQEIGDRSGEAATWHQLATIDLREGDYAAARDKFAKALAIEQQIGDRYGEAATWHQLASIDVNEGDYAAARDKFAKNLAMLQEIGDRPGEAATWHNLATIDLREGDYAAARDKFAKALAMRQQIGERAGEAATLYQLGSLAVKEGHLLPAAKLVGLCFLIDQAIGHGDTQKDLQAFLSMCERLKLTEPQVHALLKEIAESYQQDRGVSLLKEAFPDWQ